MTRRVTLDLPTCKYLAKQAERVDPWTEKDVLRFATLGLPPQGTELANQATRDRFSEPLAETRTIEIDAETYNKFATMAVRSKYDYSPGEIIEHRYRDQV